MDDRAMQSIKIGDYAEVKRLIDKGKDVNKPNNAGETALMWTTWGGHIDIVKLLIEAGADVNAREFFGDTALIWATWERHTEVVKLLIEAGADVYGQYKCPSIEGRR